MDGTRCIPESSATLENTDGGVLPSRSEKDIAKIMDHLDVYCCANPGIFVRLSLPGSRESSSELSGLLYRERRIFCQDNTTRCVRAAVANGVHALEGDEDAMLMMEKDDFVVERLSQAEMWLETYFSMFCLQKEP